MPHNIAASTTCAMPPMHLPLPLYCSSSPRTSSSCSTSYVPSYLHLLRGFLGACEATRRITLDLTAELTLLRAGTAQDLLGSTNGGVRMQGAGQVRPGVNFGSPTSRAPHPRLYPQYSMLNSSPSTTSTRSSNDLVYIYPLHISPAHK